MEVFNISIITLSKNNKDELLTTCNSIIYQDIKEKVEWLIIDESNKKNKTKIIKLIKEKNNILKDKFNVKIINMKNEGVGGIYPSMNFALKIAKGYSLIFMNSGDEFFNKSSLRLMYRNLSLLKTKDSFVFGQARIISKRKIIWNFPGNKLSNFKKWLIFFEPNHQAMLITKSLATKKFFDEKNKIFADGNWKRNIIKNAKASNYIPYPTCKFYLGGISSKKPNLTTLRSQLKVSKLSMTRKIIIFLKFLTPQYIYKYYPLFQKYKSMFFDFIL